MSMRPSSHRGAERCIVPNVATYPTTSPIDQQIASERPAFVAENGRYANPSSITTSAWVLLSRMEVSNTTTVEIFLYYKRGQDHNFSVGPSSVQLYTDPYDTCCVVPLFCTYLRFENKACTRYGAVLRRMRSLTDHVTFFFLFTQCTHTV
jgi:hypothetical protein